MSYPKGPPRPPQQPSAAGGSIADSVVDRSNNIVEGTQELSQIQQVAAQQMQRVMHATSTLQDAAIQSAVIAAGSAPASSGGAPQISAAGGTVKISQPASADSQKEALQSALVQFAGQAVPAVVNLYWLKFYGTEAPPGVSDLLGAMLLQAVGAGVATLANNLPFWLGRKRVQK